MDVAKYTSTLWKLFCIGWDQEEGRCSFPKQKSSSSNIQTQVFLYETFFWILTETVTKTAWADFKYLGRQELTHVKNKENILKFNFLRNQIIKK